MMNYFTAGVLVVLGIVLMVGFTKQSKLFIPVGIVCILFGGWWGFSEFLPEDSPINGWVGILIKIIAGATLIALVVVLVLVQKRERAKFKLEMEGKDPEQVAIEEAKPKPLYEKYEDFDYDIQRIDDEEENKDSSDDETENQEPEQQGPEAPETDKK